MPLNYRGADAFNVRLTGGDATTPDISQYTVDTIVDWLHKYENAPPSFKPGDVLTNKDIKRLTLMVPGYLEQLNFPGARVEIATTPENHLPRQDFLDCTEKYQNQVVLKKDGAGPKTALFRSAFWRRRA